MSWNNTTNNINEAIFGNKDYIPDAPGHIPSPGGGIGNAQGWIAFFAMIGAVLGAIVGRGVLGAVTGALVAGGGLFVIVRLVGSKNTAKTRSASVGSWTKWAFMGAAAGALIPVGLAAAAGDMDDMETVLLLGAIFAAPGAALSLLVRMFRRRRRAA